MSAHTPCQALGAVLTYSHALLSAPHPPMGDPHRPLSFWIRILARAYLYLKRFFFNQTLQTLMQHYEIMYIVPLKVTGDDPGAVQDKVRTMLQAEGAHVSHEESLGKRKLAYPIDHVRHGHYVVLECDLPADKVKPVNDWFRLSPEILRAMVITKKVKSPAQLERERTLQAKLARMHAKAEEA